MLDAAPVALLDLDILKLDLSQPEQHPEDFRPAPQVEVIKSVGAHLFTNPRGTEFSSHL